MHWPWFINNIPLFRDEFRNENSLQDATWLLHYCVELDKARHVRSNDSILSYSTFFRAYELHTKVIYLRNSFRFDFKWRELTANLPAMRIIALGERDREKREVLGRSSISSRRGKTLGYNERSMWRLVQDRVVSYRRIPFREIRFLPPPFVPLDPIVPTIRSRWSDHASFVTRPIALRRSLCEWYST